jgi:hypothetical protein
LNNKRRCNETRGFNEGLCIPIIAIYSNPKEQKKIINENDFLRKAADCGLRRKRM